MVIGSMADLDSDELIVIKNRTTKTETGALLTGNFTQAQLLKSPHWLPVQCSIIFKICTITCTKQLSNQSTPARIPRQLQSSSSDLLLVPQIETNTGTWAFSVATPTLCNSIPLRIKSAGNIIFCRHMKTDLLNLVNLVPRCIQPSVDNLNTV